MFPYDLDFLSLFCRTLRSSWEVLKLQIERIAHVHISLSASIMEQLTRVNSLVDKNREKRKAVSGVIPSLACLAHLNY
jgi:hypothetical protein